MTHGTASYAAFHELVDLLRDTADSWLSADNEVKPLCRVVQIKDLKAAAR